MDMRVPMSFTAHVKRAEFLDRCKPDEPLRTGLQVPLLFDDVVIGECTVTKFCDEYVYLECRQVIHME